MAPRLWLAMMAVEYLYGYQPVICALKTGARRITQLLLYEGAAATNPRLQAIRELARASGVRIQYTTKMQLDELCQHRPHQNVALQTLPLSLRATNAPLEEALSVLLADVGDPQNVGSIIRSAAYFGIGRLYLTQECSTLTPTVSKASAGALEWYHGRMAGCGRGTRLLEEAGRRGWRILATGEDTDGRPCPDDDHPERANKTILVFGSEGGGLRKGLLDLCNGSANIPGVEAAARHGLDSLNVGVAAALLMSKYAAGQAGKRKKQID